MPVLPPKDGAVSVLVLSDPGRTGRLSSLLIVTATGSPNTVTGKRTWGNTVPEYGSSGRSRILNGHRDGNGGGELSPGSGTGWVVLAHMAQLE